MPARARRTSAVFMSVLVCICLLSALCFACTWLLVLAPPRSGRSQAAACPFCSPDLCSPWPCTTQSPFSFSDPFLPVEGWSAQGRGGCGRPNPSSDPIAAVASGQLPQLDRFGCPHPMSIVVVLAPQCVCLRTGLLRKESRLNKFVRSVPDLMGLMCSW